MSTTAFRSRHAFTALVCLLVSISFVSAARAQRVNLLSNGGFEDGSFEGSPVQWSPQVFSPSASMTWDVDAVHEGSHSVKITADSPNDAGWTQTVNLKPDTNYLLSGWVKTEHVAHTVESVDAGANLCLFGTWQHSTATMGTTDWTAVRMTFNSGSTGSVTIGARLGFWSGTTTGTAWFDDLRVTEILPSDPHPAWTVLVLVYDATDFTYVDAAASRHVVGQIGEAQVTAAIQAATRFVMTDIPLLSSGNMVPSVTVRVAGTLRRLSPNSIGWWPAPDDTAADWDPAFDSVIVIWQPTVIDQSTGESLWIGSAAGLTPSMGVGQMYTTLIIEAATLYGHVNVFKHEWGHSILDYFDAAGTSPRPTVSNHADSQTYVNCQTGQFYTWIDETDANLIANSIYNNDSGFTHDYYSGTTAVAANPTSCLGIPPVAWATDGPVSKAVIDLTVSPGSDTTPPTTIVEMSPPADTSGWNNADVTVGLTAIDNGGGSGVQQMTDGVAGPQPVSTTTVAGNKAVASISSEGLSTVSFYAADVAGNVEPARTVTVRLDRTPPTIAASRITMPNPAGWNHAPVTVEFDCTDTLSGVAGASAMLATTSSEGADQTLEGRCTDLAGNSATLTVAGINIDRTAPVLSGATDQSVRQTTAAGAIATYPFPAVEETGSGVSSQSCVPASGTLFPVGVTTVICTVIDRAGNTGSTQFNVIVTPGAMSDGHRMSGSGVVVQGRTHHHFEFWVAPREGSSSGQFQYWTDSAKGCLSGDDRPGRRAEGDHDGGLNRHDSRDRFEATAIDRVVFSGGSRRGREHGLPDPVASVSFSGRGTWNGRAGYTFEASAVDAGTSRRRRDAFSLVIRDRLRRIVATVTGPREHGEIHSTR